MITAAGIYAVLYLPGYFMKTPGTSEETAVVQTDTTAIRKTNTALRNYPSDDFDGDGLSNADETALGTDPWNIDTDEDGASDYYEAKISKTDPLNADKILVDVQTKDDKSKGKNVGSPYKIGNVILWADDYSSKAYGSVVETLTGYHFTAFDGYAQFPSGKYAYRVKDGVRSLMSYRKEENAWKVSAGDFVEVYDKPLEEIVEISFFSHPVYVNSSIVTNILANILPPKGFITAEKKMKIDVDPDTGKSVTTEIVKPAFDSTDDYRYTVNHNTLNDLQFVRKSIEEDNCCIAVSLYNENAGEYIGIVYGYTSSGDLLIADMDTLEPIGTLKITESARKMLDDNGDLVSVSYYDFSGFGFNSQAGDRISFFASSSKSNALNNKIKKEKENNTDETDKEDTQDNSESKSDTAEEASDKAGQDSQEETDSSKQDNSESEEADSQNSEETESTE